MKLRDILSEQAIKVSANVAAYQKWIAHMQANRQQYPVVGRIDAYEVISDGSNYGLADDQQNVVAYYEVVRKTSERAELKNLYVIDSHRGQNLSAMFILFLKAQLHYKQIIIDYRHSSEMRRLLKRLHSRFKVEWINQDTGQTEPYDDNTIDQYYDNTPPNRADLWTILVEHKFDALPVMLTEAWAPPQPAEMDQFYCIHFPTNRQDEEFMLPRHVSAWTCGL